MKKLEDIPKKDFHHVPEGYFDQLPGTIQSRVTQSARNASPAFTYSLKYALAITALVVVAAVFWFQRAGKQETAETMLASVETEDLVAWLSNDELSTEELLDDVALRQEDADHIQEAVFEIGLQQGDFDDIFDELD